MTLSKRERNKKLLAEVKAQLKNKTALLNDAERAMLELLELAFANIIKLLDAQPSDYQQWYLPQISRQIEAILSEFVQTGTVQAEAHLLKGNNLGADAISSPLSAAGLQRVTQAVPVLVPQQLQALNQFTATRIKDVAREFGSYIDGQIGLVLVGSQSQHQAMAAIKEKIELPRYRIRTIMRTNLSQIYSSAQAARMEQLKPILPGMKKRWLKSGKFHARESHRRANRQVADIEKPFLIGGVKMMRPHDPKAPAKEVINCGCTMVVYMESWEVIENKIS